MKILIFGGFSPPYTGQRINNDVLYRELKVRHTIFKLNLKFSFEGGKFKLFELVFDSLKIYVKSIFLLQKVEVVYSTMSQSKFGFLRFFPVLLLCRVFNIPYIIHLKGNLLPETINNSTFFLKKLIMSTLKHSNSVIFLSERLAEQNVFNDLANKHVVYNFVDNYIFINSIDEKYAVKKNDSKINILYLSNLMEEKGILDLLESVRKLQNSGVKQYHLHIAGDIDKKIKNKIEYYFRILDKSSFTYYGKVSGDEKKNLYLKSDIFVLPTYYKQEGQPITLLEAMATGNTIITTKHSGIPDIVNENNGFFVKQNSPNELYELLLKLISDKEQLHKYAKYNIKYSRQFTVNKFINSIESILLKSLYEEKI